MTVVYLVRHAHALGRGDWRQADDIRPLDERGKDQARALADALDDEPVKRILSSPAVRCLATVAPLAERLGLEIERTDELLEGASVGAAVRLVEDVARNDGTAVLCSHGDLIPDVLRKLAAGGLRFDEDMRWPKGSAWALEWDGQRFVSAHLVPTH